MGAPAGDHRPAWLRRCREDRSLSSDIADLQDQLEKVFLDNYEVATPALWRKYLKHQVQQSQPDFLAEHLLGAVRNPRPMDGTVMLAFSYHFSLAFSFLGSAIRANSQNDELTAWGYLADARYFAGACSAEAPLTAPTATKAGHLKHAREQRLLKDRVSRELVTKWCDTHFHKYSGNCSKAAEAAVNAKLVPVTSRTIYKWILEWNRGRASR